MSNRIAALLTQTRLTGAPQRLLLAAVTLAALTILLYTLGAPAYDGG